MVLTKAYKRKTITGNKWLDLLFILEALILLSAIVISVWFKIENVKDPNTTSYEGAEEIADITEVEPETQPEQETPEESVLPPRVDFQGVIDEWVRSIGGKKSVVIYDLDRDEVVGTYNPDENYSTASLYKLFVVYEGYRRLQSGEWQGDVPAGSTGYTVRECLDLSIRRSYSPCAETLWGMIGRNELDRIIADEYHITNSDISNLVSNPNDMVKIMRRYYEHTDIKDEGLLSLIKDSFLNQPVTEYDWRQGLPSGFKRAIVYNKVGWDYNGSSWNVYHDVAIVEYPEQNRHYVVVVMTSQVPFQRIRDLGTRIEAKFYAE